MKILSFSLLVVIADQISKLFIKGISIPFLNIKFDGMQYGQSTEVLGNFFRITFVENPGMAFGIGVGQTGKLFLTIFSLIASIGIIIYMYKLKEEKFVVRFALALILGGAVGNFIDRMFYGVLFDYAPFFYGRVVDFLDVDFFDISLFGKSYTRWPIFNIADSAVSVGVVLLLFFYNLAHKEEEIEAVTTDNVVEPLVELNRVSSFEEKNVFSENNDCNDNNRLTDGETDNREDN